MRTLLYCLLFTVSFSSVAAQPGTDTTKKGVTISIHDAVPVADTCTMPLAIVGTFATPLPYLVIDPNNIDSINILKNGTALGQRARNGVIRIYPKKNARLLTLRELYERFSVAPADRTLRVCIDEVVVDAPELLLVDESAIAGVNTFTHTDWNNPAEPKSETFLNITRKKQVSIRLK